MYRVNFTFTQTYLQIFDNLVSTEQKSSGESTTHLVSAIFLQRGKLLISILASTQAQKLDQKLPPTPPPQAIAHEKRHLLTKVGDDRSSVGSTNHKSDLLTDPLLYIERLILELPFRSSVSQQLWTNFLIVTYAIALIKIPTVASYFVFSSSYGSTSGNQPLA